MVLIHDHPHLRAEFDWLAIDECRHVGFFSTAGMGPLPEDVVARGDLYETLETEILAMSECCDASVLAASGYDWSDWLAVARRGFFAFDWRWETKRYELIARPSDPDLCGALREATIVASAVVLPGVDFCHTTSLIPAGGLLVSHG
jgi:hypothetical protein